MEILFSDEFDIELRLGERVHISGGTTPQIARQKLVLRFRALAATDDWWGPTKTLARLRTSAKGGFRYSWRPAYRVIYQVWAVYPRQRRRLLSDESCPVYINVL